VRTDDCATEFARCFLRLAITGGGKWVEVAAHADSLYQHRCVESGEPPRLFWVEPPKPPIEAVRVATSFVLLKASKDVIPGAKSPHAKSPHRNATLSLVIAGPVSKGRHRIFTTARDCRPRKASPV
jgi:hypothetical protein